MQTAIAAFICLTAAGCYDGDKLVAQVRDKAIRTRLEEVPLGSFRTTLPRDTVEITRMEVDIELFGTALRYKIPDIEEAIERDNHRLRRAVITSLRETTAEEIKDPSLTSLRARLTEVVNQQLADTPVKTLGIRHVRFIPL